MKRKLRQQKSHHQNRQGKNLSRKQKGVFVDYKYGPLTTLRRNLALKRRRELLNSGELSKAHVAYPARLMGLKGNEKKYKLIEDFSATPVCRR